MNKKHGANCVGCLGFIDFRIETFVKTHDQYYHVKCFQSPLCANPLCGKKITKGLVVKVLSTRAFSPAYFFAQLISSFRKDLASRMLLLSQM